MLVHVREFDMENVPAVCVKVKDPPPHLKSVVNVTVPGELIVNWHLIDPAAPCDTDIADPSRFHTPPFNIPLSIVRFPDRFIVVFQLSCVEVLTCTEPVLETFTAVPAMVMVAPAKIMVASHVMPDVVRVLLVVQ